MNIHKKRIDVLYQSLAQMPDWDAAFILNKVNLYYYTGCTQDGVLVLRKDGQYGFFVRKSLARAKEEVQGIAVYPMRRYSDILDIFPGNIDTVYLESDTVTLTILNRMKKCFSLNGEIRAIEPVILKQRMIKNKEELAIMRECGKLHQQLLTEVVPELLTEGISETQLTACIYAEMVRLGYQGISRFSMFQTEMVVGQLGFSENSIFPTSFDGPGGMKGMSPAVPIVGDRNRLLQKTDLVFVDIGFGVDGYHTDKTQVYSFGTPAPEFAVQAHEQCREIQNYAASLLKAGTLPSVIYQKTMQLVPNSFRENFMGLGADAVKFLGHGIGLQVDEPPAIAVGFDEPLQAGMAIALEPKKCIPGYGIVGVEETYLIGEEGNAECITGGNRAIITV